MSSVVQSQTTSSVSVGVTYDDNAFRNYQEVSDYITQLNFYVAKDYEEVLWNFRLFYDGSLNIFAEYGDRFYHFHKVGVAASRPFGNSGGLFNFGGNVALNRYREPYDYINYVQGFGYANVRFKPSGSLITQFGYTLKYRNYDNLPEFSHFEHQGFGRVSWFLPTKTSLIFYSRIGLKDYESQTVTTTSDLSEGGMGRGPGHGRNPGSVVISEYQTPTTSQLIASVKLGQSITTNTGLSIQVLRRLQLEEGARYSYDIGEFFSYSSEDELFDDPYSYEGYEMGTALTQLLPWQVTAKLGYDHLIKNYDYEAINLTGDPLISGEERKDTRDVFWMSLNKSMLWFRNMQFSIDFYYVKNDSNDPYFNYDNSVFTFGTSMSF